MPSKHSQAPVLISQGVFDSVKAFSEFEQRVSALFDTNTKAQGDAFEIFVEAYLATQPMLQCEETWLVGDIPVDIREALNLPSDSKGIDGVYRSMLDDIIPYQVKFRSNRPALGFNEVAPFLGITEKATDRLLITNCDTIAIDVQNRTGIRSLRGVDFDQLTEEDFTVIENWLKQKPKKRQPLTPDPYQVEALTNIANHLGSNDRGTVVMACGTGKTLVALWTVEQSKAKTILVLVPSLTLLQQTLEEWSVHNSWGKDFSYLCVCSDPSVNLKNDEIEIDPSDVPFRIDTDPEIVKGFLAQNNGKTKIVFSTYQSSQVVSQATKGDFEFDIAVFDEAHKTTGSAQGRFALALKDENIKIKKRLFLTATPKHYDISKRDKDGEFKFVSMDNEAVYGKRAHTLTFGEAAAKGIICPYKVVITLIDKQQVDDFALKNGITLIEGDAINAKWVASQIAVSSAIEHTKAKKIITFHSRVKTAREFASDEVYGIKKLVDDFEVFHVHGKQKSNERKDTISKFRKASRSIITNAKCLTEGVDLPAVDMVAFVDPRHSKIDIAQAVGRAMRNPRGGDKTVGYIVVPIFAENNSEKSIEKAIISEDFDDISFVLNALLEQDDEFVEIIRELKQDIGKGRPFNPRRIKIKVDVIGPQVKLDDLANSILIEAVNRLGESWDESYGKLQKYLELNGDCLVHNDYVTDEGYTLGRWVMRQRSHKKLGLLSFRQIELLNCLGSWTWDPIEDQWNEGFNYLKIYKEREGHCYVPRKHIESGYPLGIWVGSQRTRNNKFSEEHESRLNSLGFIWDPLAEQWEEGFLLLEKFKQREGHCLVPLRFIEESFKIGNWVIRQRKNKDNLSSEDIKRLDSLGFSWNPLAKKWYDAFLFLKIYNKREGHSKVPTDHIEEKFPLGYWVARQRKFKNKLSKKRQSLLNSLDLIWSPLEKKWEEAFMYLMLYKVREGNFQVPHRHKENGFSLGQWVNVQRRLKNKLSDEQLHSLNEVGFEWIPNYIKQWDEGFKYLKEFKDREGHCLVPERFIYEGFKIGHWVRNQRANKVNLSIDYQSRLNSLGFIWDPLAEQWEEGFLLLEKFKQREGHCLVPVAYKEEKFYLGRWVHHQRSKKSLLTQARLKKLNSISFVWDPLAEQWQKAFRLLEKFSKREGHCLVPQRFKEDGFSLGSWVSKQRNSKHKLSEELQNRLESLGFIWSSGINPDQLGFDWNK